MFCKNCGNQLDGNDNVCGKCGTANHTSPTSKKGIAVPENRHRDEPLLYRFNEWLSRHTKGVIDMRKVLRGAHTSEIERQGVSLAWKYAILFLTVALILVFWFMPTLHLEFPYDTDFENDEVGMGIGNFPTLFMTEDEDTAMGALMVMVSLWFWFVLPLMICALQLGLPLLTRKVLKRRRLIYPIMVSFHCFLSNLLFEIGFGYAFKYIDHIDVSVTVAGVLLPILQLIWIVMLFVATSQSKSIASEIEKANAQSHTLESVE